MAASSIDMHTPSLEALHIPRKRSGRDVPPRAAKHGKIYSRLNSCVLVINSSIYCKMHSFVAFVKCKIRQV